MYGQKKNFSTFSYKLVQISPIMILVHSGAFLSISSWFCELTELIFVMIPYISSTGCPPTTQRIMGHVQVANFSLATCQNVACVADETKPRYSPSANQRPKACSAPRVLPVLSIIGSNWLLHIVVLSCTVIGRVDVVEPWLRSR